MKICFITHYGELYGANKSLLDLIKGLKKFKVESFVLARYQGYLTKELETLNVPFYVCPFELWMSEPSKSFRKDAIERVKKNIRYIPKLLKQVKKWNPDVIYTNSSVTPIGLMLAKILRKKHVWHVREFGKLDYYLEYDWGRKVFEWGMNQSDAVIAVSNAIKDKVLKNIKTKIFVVHNGVVSQKELNKLKKNKIKNTRLCFGIISLIYPNKGQETAIRAVSEVKKKYPNIKLLIFGNGQDNEIERLKEIIKKLNLEKNVQFRGYVQDPFKAYEEVYASLVCSKYDAFGRTVAEAMAAGKVVIANNTTGIAEQIENGADGLLYNGTHKDLARKMIWLIENKQIKNQIIKKARKKIENGRTNEICAEKTIGLIKIQNENLHREGI